jgi:hypothetical protein
MTYWLVRVYHWCELCGQKACNDGDRMCPACLGRFQLLEEEVTHG